MLGTIACDHAAVWTLTRITCLDDLVMRRGGIFVNHSVV